MNELVYHNKILTEKEACHEMERFVNQISAIDTDNLEMAQTGPQLTPDPVMMNRVSEEITPGIRKVSDDPVLQSMMPSQPQEEEAKMITLIDKHKSGGNRKQNRNTVAIFSNHKSGSSNTSNKQYIIKSPGHRLSSGLKEDESDDQALKIFSQFQQKGAAKKVKHTTTRILGAADDYEGQQTETLKQATTKKGIKHKGYLSGGSNQLRQRPLSEQITIFGH